MLLEDSVQGVAEEFSGDCGEFNIYYYFEDECGRFIEANQTVTVIDNKVPELTIPENDEVECNAIPEVGEASAIDNCDSHPSVTYLGETISDQVCTDSYTITRTWRANDNCGNSTSLSQTIIVRDTTDPVLTVPADDTVECDAIPEIGEATATDNCDDNVEVVFLDEKTEAGPCAHSYTIIRIWRATDNCGNQDIKSQMITVQDTTPPVITVPENVTVECDAIPEVGMATATDNCDEQPKVEFTDEKREDGNCPNNYTSNQNLDSF